MKYKEKLLCIIIFIAHSNSAINNKKAVTVIPVVDIFGEPFFEKKFPFSYTVLPYSANKPRYLPRLHQVLYNEVVTVLEEQGDELKISVPNVFYQTENAGTKYNTFWAKKSHFILLENLKKHNIDLHIFPKPFSRTHFSAQDKYAILRLPYKNRATGLYFSAGTRFVRASTIKNGSTVYVFDPKTYTVQLMTIPNSYLMPDFFTQQEKQKAFVSLLRSWTHIHNRHIPYVWGGCSFITAVSDNTFVSQEKIINQQKTTFYSRPTIMSSIASGFDCSGLIVRAAQICTIPYFFKNTSTLFYNLAAINSHNVLNEGDLLWFPGHVMIIADITRGTFIEARSYDHGYGIVHEIPFSKVFQNINTTQDLVKAYLAHEPLIRLNVGGSSTQVISHFELLSFSSVWNSRPSAKNRGAA